jgi:hypothetical protein
MGLESQIEATGRYSAFVDEWARYECSALHTLDGAGVEDLSTLLEFTVNMPQSSRYELWLADTIVWTMRKVRAGLLRDAFRGLLQMSEYCGRLGGWPDSTSHDCYTALMNYLQDKVAPL